MSGVEDDITLYFKSNYSASPSSRGREALGRGNPALKNWIATPRIKRGVRNDGR